MRWLGQGMGGMHEGNDESRAAGVVGGAFRQAGTAGGAAIMMKGVGGVPSRPGDEGDDPAKGKKGKAGAEDHALGDKRGRQ